MNKSYKILTTVAFLFGTLSLLVSVLFAIARRSVMDGDADLYILQRRISVTALTVGIAFIITGIVMELLRRK